MCVVAVPAGMTGLAASEKLLRLQVCCEILIAKP
jgi:hypothetical protein